MEYKVINCKVDEVQKKLNDFELFNKHYHIINVSIYQDGNKQIAMIILGKGN